MGSGSDKRQRNKRINFRVFDDEFNKIAAKADRSGLTLGAFMRAAALDGDSGPRAQRRPPADHKALRQILGEIGRIGNNINQMARALNSGDKLSRSDMEEALRACLDIRKKIYEALGKNPGPNTGPGP
jgi:hypothetical protein